jgi:hypothetical protein
MVKSRSSVTCPRSTGVNEHIWRHRSKERMIPCHLPSLNIVSKFGFRSSSFWSDQSLPESSSSNCFFKFWRADFLIARRSAATACFSACRSCRVRLSILLGRCEIFGRFAPIFRSLGFAYGSMGESYTLQDCCPLRFNLAQVWRVEITGIK